jgi:response regulator RpfG family c-di-GMP phosphodiesterase
MSAPSSETPVREAADNPRPSTFDAQAAVKGFVESGIIHLEEWNALPTESLTILGAAHSLDTLLRQLHDLKLLTSYQADRIRAGAARGLVLGNYRVLDRIGAGGLGLVFEAEHSLMRRRVAIKVLAVSPEQPADLIARFVREMRAIALLDHPNIVAAIDAGVCPGADRREPDLYYFVMEHLSGKDLESSIRAKPLAVSEACGLIYQAASALDEAHRHQLVHRDIKPSNIFVTNDGVAKLLDFGLMRNLSMDSIMRSRDFINALDYVAPEQTHPAAAVDIRADIFSLGATLFFALTGRSPFADDATISVMVKRRQTLAAPRASSLRDDVPEALDAVMKRMLELNPDERYPTPQVVMHALLPFLTRKSEGKSDPNLFIDRAAARTVAAPLRRPCVLVVDGDARTRRDLTRVLAANSLDFLEADSMERALLRLRGSSIEAVLIGVDAPSSGGHELLRVLRDNPPVANLKILVTSTQESEKLLSAFLQSGADDCLSLPLSDVQLAGRVHAAIRHKEAQDELDHLNQRLLELNVELERSLTAQTNDFVQSRNALVLALARLVEYRSTETLAHLTRIQRYCAVLAQEASVHPRLAGQIDQEFIQTLECVAPLHDIGNVGLPDSILLKAGPLDPAEREKMQQHTTIGAETLRDVALRFGAESGFLRMAIDVARHHHEHFDGTGYPDRLAGNDIPLAARLVALADAYDSLRSRRAQRPRLSHASALQILLEASPGKFDPILLRVFQSCAQQLDRLHADIQDSFMVD